MFQTFFGQSTENQLKDKHITSLRQYYPYLNEDIKYRSYTVPLFFKTFPNTSIKITMEPNFPNSAPVVQLLPEGLDHILLDDRGYIKKTEYLAIAKWNTTSDLGRLIVDLNTEFGRNEPVWRVSLPSYQSIKTEPVRNNIPVKPRYQNNIPELDKLGVEEMKTLVNDESKFKEFVSTIESINSSVNLKNELVNTNIETKEKISVVQSETKSLEDEVSQLKIQLEQLRDQQNTNTRIQESILSKYSAQNITKYLTEKAQQLEDTTENLGDDFIKGKLSLEEFLTQFEKTRKEYHLAQIKAK